MENVNILFLLLQAVLTQQRPPPVYELEVYFVVDKSVLNRYVAEQTFGNPVRKGLASLKADFDYIVTEINELFASLRPKGLDIRILIKRLDVLKINLFADNVHKSEALQEFDNWLTAEGAYATVVYDAAILLTSLDFQQPGKKQLCINENSISFSALQHILTVLGVPVKRMRNGWKIWYTAVMKYKRNQPQLQS
ncbi:hypothetical protein PoB_004559800 [Plakobranchus ocellatus]|uniref:Uncharacterized protein n=1 Tax=Plakobranchus ocellatus TaxID=259542 RepID=A0AAV4BJY8_9GAST|nr:hypothetical protein PoB_004559800 [Plakobranchus ocellatus]